VWIAVGPEGGFEPREIEAWTRQGWRRAGLGPRTLRADTAGVVAAAIVLHRWGDLGAGSRPVGDC
jgi:16S rRNA (uracil1498-N3)-methyltransferase